MKENFSLQEYFTLGYIYLLVLGILGDSIYYRFFGINILSYSSISDVLLSPITTIVENPIALLAPAVGLGVVYYSRTRWSPNFHQKHRDKRWYRRLYNVEKLDRKYDRPVSTNTVVSLAATLMLVFFLGLEVGRGIAVSRKVREGRALPDHTVVFRDEEAKSITLIGQNSQSSDYPACG